MQQTARRQKVTHYLLLSMSSPKAFDGVDSFSFRHGPTVVVVVAVVVDDVPQVRCHLLSSFDRL